MGWLSKYLVRQGKEPPVQRCCELDGPSESLKRLRQLVESLEFTESGEDIYQLNVLKGSAEAQILKNTINVGVSYTLMDPGTYIPYHAHDFEVEHIIITDGELHVEVNIEGKHKHYKITKNGYFKICPKMLHRFWTEKDIGATGIVVLVPGSDHWPGYTGKDPE